MGKLTNLNPPAQIADADLPTSIASDAEVTAALAAHVNTADTHLQYLTQTSGDARYIANEQGLILRLKKFSGVTDATTGNANFLHGLDSYKILQISCLIGSDGCYPPAYIAANFGKNAEYNVFFTILYFYIVCGPNNANLKNQPYKVLITYEA